MSDATLTPSAGPAVERELTAQELIDQHKLKRQPPKRSPRKVNRKMMPVIAVSVVGLLALFGILPSLMEEVGPPPEEKVYAEGGSTSLSRYGGGDNNEGLLAYDETPGLNTSLGVAPPTKSRSSLSSVKSGPATSTLTQPPSEKPVAKSVPSTSYKSSPSSSSYDEAALDAPGMFISANGLTTPPVQSGVAGQTTLGKGATATQGQQAAQYASYDAVNDRANKDAFSTLSAPSAAERLENPTLVIRPGTFIPAMLASSVNTDLPGAIKAITTAPVYDSITGKNLLIPPGSVLIANYNSAVSFGQSRLQIGWVKLMRPDNYQVDLGNALGVDAQGAAGVTGDVDYHILSYIGAFALTTTLQIGNSYMDKMVNGPYAYTDSQRAVMENTQQFGNDVGAALLSNVMNRQPTIYVKEGTPINVFVQSEIMLPPSSQPRPALPSSPSQTTRY